MSRGKENRIPGKGQVEILNRLAMKGFTKWGHLSKDLTKVREQSMQTSGGWTFQCKGPEAEACLACCRDIKEADVLG